ncbi:MAG: phosphatase PAP2 family protein [Candidatus Binatia bacterium]
MLRLLALLGALLLPAPVCDAQETPPASIRSVSPPEGQLNNSEPCLANVSGCFERHALGLAPTHPGFTIDFPLQFARRTFWDTGYILTAPGRWDRSDWTRFSLFAAGTGATMGLDHQIDIASRLHHPRSGTEGSVEDAIQEFGDLPGGAVVAGAPLVFGLLAGNEDAARLGVDVGEALFVANLALTEPLKEIFGRSRPNAGKGAFHFTPLSGGASLPSGHSTTAFALAASVSEHFDNPLWLAVPAYGLATGVAVARIRADAHFLSDVFVGGVIGTVTARTVARLERQRATGAGENPKPGLEVTPLLGSTVRGIEVTLRF